MSRIIREEVVAGFPLKLEQSTSRRFTITYGEQVKSELTQSEAAKEYGLCLFHALACSGRLSTEE